MRNLTLLLPLILLGCESSKETLVGVDNDGDNYLSHLDCNDDDADINPGRTVTVRLKKLLREHDDADDGDESEEGEEVFDELDDDDDEED